LDIIFENNDFVVLNKPAALLSIPDRTQSAQSLKDMLQEKYGRIFTVHRLDRETSGLIVFAKTESAHQSLSQAFEERMVEKIYLGLVKGIPVNKKGSIDAPIMEHPARNGLMVVNKKGKPALTDYETLEEFGLYSLVQFQIHTGRTHQIRVHMQHLGHPIACDELYGDGKPVFISSLKRNFKLSKTEEEEKPILSRLALHSAHLNFKDMQGNDQRFEAPLPKDMKALLQQLRKWKS
jgi:23S rRNA pseudouridine955/2504/2580 synthase/23S rRNA pseudouridine1911/1915/1917 synthase